jgi:hypothetical protein
MRSSEVNKKKTVALLGLFVITFLAFHSVVDPTGRHYVSMASCLKANTMAFDKSCRHAFFGIPLSAR